MNKLEESVTLLWNCLEMQFRRKNPYNSIGYDIFANLDMNSPRKSKFKIKSLINILNNYPVVTHSIEDSVTLTSYPGVDYNTRTFYYMHNTSDNRAVGYMFCKSKSDGSPALNSNCTIILFANNGKDDNDNIVDLTTPYDKETLTEIFMEYHYDYFYNISKVNPVFLFDGIYSNDHTYPANIKVESKVNKIPVVHLDIICDFNYNTGIVLTGFCMDDTLSHGVSSSGVFINELKRSYYKLDNKSKQIVVTWDRYKTGVKFVTYNIDNNVVIDFGPTLSHIFTTSTGLMSTYEFAKQSIDGILKLICLYNKPLCEHYGIEFSIEGKKTYITPKNSVPGSSSSVPGSSSSVPGSSSSGHESSGIMDKASDFYNNNRTASNLGIGAAGLGAAYLGYKWLKKSQSKSHKDSTSKMRKSSQRRKRNRKRSNKK